MIKINEYESIQIVSYQDIKRSDEIGNLMWANTYIPWHALYCKIALALFCATERQLMPDSVHYITAASHSLLRMQ